MNRGKNVWEKIVRLADNEIGFVKFIKAHVFLTGSMAFFLTLVYAGQAFSNYFYIDKECPVNNPGSFYNWIEIGRYGLVFIKKIMGMSWYNPYLNGVLLIVALWLTAMAAGYLISLTDGRIGAVPLGIFMLLFLIYPTYTELFFFQYQALEIVLAMLMLLVSDWYLVQAIKEKNMLCFLVSLPLTVIAFGVYQSMVVVQMCLYLCIFLTVVHERLEDKAIVRASIIYSVGVSQ